MGDVSNRNTVPSPTRSKFKIPVSRNCGICRIKSFLKKVTGIDEEMTVLKAILQAAIISFLKHD